jgi:hypothetical protein
VIVLYYAYRILVGKPEGKRPLGRPRHRWVDSIKMDLRLLGWGGMYWIDLAEDRDQWRTLVSTESLLNTQDFIFLQGHVFQV